MLPDQLIVRRADLWGLLSREQETRISLAQLLPDFEQRRVRSPTVNGGLLLTFLVSAVLASGLIIVEFPVGIQVFGFALAALLVSAWCMRYRRNEFAFRFRNLAGVRIVQIVAAGADADRCEEFIRNIVGAIEQLSDDVAIARQDSPPAHR